MQKFLTIFLILPLLNFLFLEQQQLDLVRITSPQEGEILQGIVPIKGSVSGLTFQQAEISFQYQETQSANWFLIGKIESQVVDDTIVIWDTSTIADGNYRIKIVAYYENNRQQEAIINNLDVRNYTLIDPGEVIEPVSIFTEEANQEIFSTPTGTESVRPSPMPQNEMIVTFSQFYLTLLQGALFGILLLVVIVLFVIIRRRKIG